MLAYVWKHYGMLPGAALISITHKPDTPWDRVFNAQENRGRKGLVIPDTYIKEHYDDLYRRVTAKAQ